MAHLWRCLLLIVPVVFGEIAQYETGDNSTVRGCSTHCKLLDSDLSCWNETLAFHQRILLTHMRNFVAVQVNIAQWQRRNHSNNNLTNAEESSVKAMTAHLHEQEFVTVDTVRTVVHALVARAKLFSNRTISWPPQVSCPIPCEYRFVTWRYLFIASVALNIALAIAVIPFICIVSRRDSHTSQRLIKR